MKLLLYTCLLSLSLLASCQQSSPPASPEPTVADTEPADQTVHFERIERIAAQLRAKASEPLDIPLAQSLVQESKAYVRAYPEAEYTPALLFRAGEVARSIGETGEALQLFVRVYERYPQSKWAVRARFMEGSTYEDDLKDKKKASQAYEILIQQHPNDPLAEQARQLLRVIDQSPEELIRQFERQNKEAAGQ